jgi:DNA repair exonuclease SbcCD ATPase subunit
MLLQGRNKNTGGGSGAGKSSFIRAINYALGTCDTPSTDLQTWGLKDPPAVKLEIVCDQQELTISRGKKCDQQELTISRGKKFDLRVNDVPEPGSASQKDQRILQAVGLNGLNYKTLQALTYRGQRKPGLFLSQTDAEKKEFLTPLLGLDKFEKIIEDSAANLRTLETSLERLTAERDAYSRGLAAALGDRDVNTFAAGITMNEDEHKKLADSIAAKEADITNLRAAYSRARLEGEDEAKKAEAAFADQIRDAFARIQELKATSIAARGSSEVERLSQMVSQCQLRIDRLTTEDLVRRDSVRHELTQLQVRLDGARRDVAVGPAALREKQRLEAEYEQLAASVCPTCERPWEETERKKEQLAEQLASVRQTIDKAEAAKLRVNAVLAEMKPLQVPFVPNPTITTLQGAQSVAATQLAAEKQRVDSERAVLVAQRERAIAEAHSVHEVWCRKAGAAGVAARSTAQGRMDELQSAAEHARQGLAVDHARRSALQSTLATLRAKLQEVERLQAQLQSAETKVSEVYAEFCVEKDFAQLIGREGFLGAIFDEVLAEISDETNQLLASVANTRHCTLRFQSESTSQKGTIKKSIVPVVTVHGHETTISAGLSGGMLSAVELAVDLAVGAVISRRSGCCPGWLILDESFDGLGALEKESCLEILQTYAQDRLVIVVDHSSETQGLFTKRVVIEYDGTDSTVVEE